MNKKIQKYALLILFMCSSAIANAQESTGKRNFKSFTEVKKNVTAQHLKLTSPKLQNHPNFGEIYEGTMPGSVELLESRTETQREFTNPDGSMTYQGVTNAGIFKDKNGYWVFPNYNLAPQNGQWKATQQKNPATLFHDASTSYEYEGQKVVFNKSVKINGEQIQFNNFTVGNNGMLAKNVLPNIDRRVQFNDESIEADFIINQKPNFIGDYSNFSEIIELPNGFSIKEGIDVDERFAGCILIYNNKGENISMYNPPVCYEDNLKERIIGRTIIGAVFVVKKLENNKYELSVKVPNSWLQSADRNFPVVIDPVYTNTIVGPLASCKNTVAYPTRPTNTEVTAPAQWAAHTNTVTVPGCQIITSYNITFQMDGVGGADWTSDMQARLWFEAETGACGSANCNPRAFLGTFNPTIPTFNNSNPFTGSATPPAPAAGCNRTGCAGFTRAATLYLTRNFTGATGACGTASHAGRNFVITVNTTQIPVSALTVTPPTQDVCGASLSLAGSVTNLCDYCAPTIIIAGCESAVAAPIPAGIQNPYVDRTFTASIQPPTIPMGCDPQVCNTAVTASGNLSNGATSCAPKTENRVYTFYPIFTENIVANNVSCSAGVPARVEILAPNGTVCDFQVFSNACTSPLPYTFVKNAASPSCIQNFTGNLVVTDLVPPVIDPAPADVTIECGTPIPLGGSLPAIDLCDLSVNSAPFTEVSALNACGLGTITRTWAVSDCKGNAAAPRVQVITIDDVTPPVIDPAPADVTIECGAAIPAGSPLAVTDACDVAITPASFTDVPALNACGLGTITRTWSKLDCKGNAAIARVQVITIDDVTPPVIDPAPADVTICGVIPTQPDLLVTDACTPGIINVKTSTSTFLDVCTPYVITYNWDAIDCKGNVAITRTQVITVLPDPANFTVVETPGVCTGLAQVVCNGGVITTVTATSTPGACPSPGGPGAAVTAPLTYTVNAGNIGCEATLTGTATASPCPEVCPLFAPLSINLLSFTGEKTTTSNLLSWVTATETANKHFELNKSVDANSAFSRIATVNSKAINGNSTSALNYSFDDLDPKIGHNYYYLNAVALDGTVERSNTIDLIWTRSGNLYNVYPNPATNNVNVGVYTSKEKTILCKLLDMSGRTIFIQNERLKIGNNQVTLDISKLADGLYTLQVIEGDKVAFVTKVRKSMQ